MLYGEKIEGNKVYLTFNKEVKINLNMRSKISNIHSTQKSLEAAVKGVLARHPDKEIYMCFTNPLEDIKNAKEDDKQDTIGSLAKEEKKVEDPNKIDLSKFDLIQADNTSFIYRYNKPKSLIKEIATLLIIIKDQFGYYYTPIHKESKSLPRLTITNNESKEKVLEELAQKYSFNPGARFKEIIGIGSIDYINSTGQANVHASISAYILERCPKSPPTEFEDYLYIPFNSQNPAEVATDRLSKIILQHLSGNYREELKLEEMPWFKQAFETISLPISSFTAKKLEASKQEVERKENSITRLTNQISKLEQEITTLKEEQVKKNGVAKKKDTKNNLATSVEELQIKQKESELSELKKSIQSNTKEINKLKDEITKLDPVSTNLSITDIKLTLAKISHPILTGLSESQNMKDELELMIVVKDKESNDHQFFYNFQEKSLPRFANIEELKKLITDQLHYNLQEDEIKEIALVTKTHPVIGKSSQTTTYMLYLDKIPEGGNLKGLEKFKLSNALSHHKVSNHVKQIIAQLEPHNEAPGGHTKQPPPSFIQYATDALIKITPTEITNPQDFIESIHIQRMIKGITSRVEEKEEALHADWNEGPFQCHMDIDDNCANILGLASGSPLEPS